MNTRGSEPVPIAIPERLWESTGEEEAVLTEWLVEDGARVEAGDVVAEIMVDKVTLEIEAPVGGTLAIAKPAQAAVHPGDLVAHIYP